MPRELRKIPWEFVKDEIGLQTTDFIAVTALLIIRFVKDQIRVQVIEKTREAEALPRHAPKDQIETVPG
jgi:hypothetical protein